MEITINFAKDTVHYDTEEKFGDLKQDLFGVESFSIHKCGSRYYVDFLIDNGRDHEIVWSYPCKFTDHGTYLVVDIKDI